MEPGACHPAATRGVNGKQTDDPRPDHTAHHTGLYLGGYPTERAGLILKTMLSRVDPPLCRIEVIPAGLSRLHQRALRQVLDKCFDKTLDKSRFMG
jgi:hypothetical protein